MYKKHLVILTLTTLLLQCISFSAIAMPLHCMEGIWSDDSTIVKKRFYLFKKKFKSDSLLNLSELTKAAPKLPFDSYKVPVIDTAKGFSLSGLRFHGNAYLSAYTSTYTYPGQLTPNTYVRWQFNPDIDLFNIPFGANLFLSTENAQFKDINSMGFRLDRNVLEQRIRNQINQQADLNRILDARKNSYNELLEKHYDSLYDQLNNPNYLAEVSKYKSIADQEKTLDSFNLAQNRTQIDKAKEKVTEYEAAQKRLKELEEKAIPYKEFKVKQKLIDEVKRNRPLDERKLAEEMGLPQKYQPLLRIIYGIKDFQFGLCYPDYSELTLKGTSVKGLDLAFNPGKIIVGVTAGKLIQPNYSGFTSEYFPVATKSITGGRVGLGKLESSFITVNYLSGKDILDRVTPGVLPKENKVVSVSGTYEVSRDFRIESEVSQSLTTPILAEGTGKSFISPLAENKDGNQAYLIKVIGRVPGINTRLAGSWRYIGPGYESYGTPFLRKDLNRYEGRADQDFFKRKLSIGAFVRQDHDNLNQTKAYRSTRLNYGLSMSLRLRKLPVLTASYSPLAQLSDQPTHTDSLLFGSEFWTIGLSYTIRKGKLTSSTFINYSTSQSRSESLSYGNKVLMFNQLLAIDKKLNLNAMLCYADARGLLQQGRRILSELSVEKTFKQKYILKTGGYYRDEFLSTNISGAFAQVSLPVSKFSDIQLRGDGFRASDAKAFQYSTLCNLLIHW